MNTIILARHGDYSEKSGRLTETGITQADALAAKIAPIVAGRSICYLTSPAYRTRETADIVAKHIPGEIKDNWELAGNVRDEDERVRLIAFINEKGSSVDVIIIFTHAHIAMHLPPHFSPAPDKKFVEQELGRGQARLLDLATGESRFI